MKRIIAALATSTLIATGAGVAIAAAASTPEVDEANATIQLAPAHLTAKTCAGEDGINYETLRGTWAGGESDLTPGSTDYSLTGALNLSSVVWTINLKTQRGLLEAAATLKGAATTALPPSTYAGRIFLVTQGLPNPAGAALPPVQARGWINAIINNVAVPVPNPGQLLANVELQVLPGLSAVGEFGNQSMHFNDISVTTNGQSC